MTDDKQKTFIEDYKPQQEEDEMAGIEEIY